MGRKKDPNKERRTIHIGTKEFEYTVDNVHGKRKLHFRDRYGRYPNGRTRFKDIYATSEIELKEKISLYLKEIASDESDQNDKLTIRQLCEEWIFYLNNDYDVDMSKVTIDKHESNVRVHIIPILGKDDVSNLETKSYISSYFAKLSNYGNSKTGGGLSLTTLKHIYSTLRLLSLYAVDPERLYIKYMGISDFKLKKEKKQNIEANSETKPFLSSDDIKSLLKACNLMNEDGVYRYHYRNIFLFILYTGLRPEEAVGLQKESCHLDEKYIEVKNTIVRHRQRDKYGKPLKSYVQELVPNTKNNSSIRAVYLCDEALEILKYVYRQFPKSKFVFTNQNGDAISLNLLNKRFKTLCKAAGISVLNYPYILRHTFATRLLNYSHIKIEHVAKLMGHSNTTTTYKSYFHQSIEEKEFIANQISAAMDLEHDGSLMKCNVDLYSLAIYAKGKGVEIYELSDEEVSKFLIRT